STGKVANAPHQAKDEFNQIVDARKRELGRDLTSKELLAIGDAAKDRVGKGGGTGGPKEADARAQAIVADANQKKQTFADDYTRNDDGSYSSNSGKPDLTAQQFQNKIDSFRVASNTKLAGLGYTVGPDGKMQKVGGTSAKSETTKSATPAVRGVHPRTPPAIGASIMVDGKAHKVVGFNQKTNKPIVDPNPQ